jgi:hypothetical protein
VPAKFLFAGEKPALVYEVREVNRLLGTRFRCLPWNPYAQDLSLDELYDFVEQWGDAPGHK